MRRRRLGAAIAIVVIVIISVVDEDKVFFCLLFLAPTRAWAQGHEGRPTVSRSASMQHQQAGIGHAGRMGAWLDGGMGGGMGGACLVIGTAGQATFEERRRGESYTERAGSSRLG